MNKVCTLVNKEQNISSLGLANVPHYYKRLMIALTGISLHRNPQYYTGSLSINLMFSKIKYLLKIFMLYYDHNKKNLVLKIRNHGRK